MNRERKNQRKGGTGSGAGEGKANKPKSCGTKPTMNGQGGPLGRKNWNGGAGRTSWK